VFPPDASACDPDKSIDELTGRPKSLRLNFGECARVGGWVEDRRPRKVVDTSPVVAVLIGARLVIHAVLSSRRIATG
ncbi:MAG: hypothetical protein ACRD1G_03380, partial [Acidimicrobiales bacterium]